MMKKFAAGAILAAAVTGILQTPSANANLVLDVRATQLNGVAIPAGAGQKSLSGIVAGDVVHLSIFAVVTGSDLATKEGFQSAEGSLLSTGSLKGNMSKGSIDANLDPAWTEQTYSSIEAGTPPNNIDLDGDGDLDVGINEHPFNGQTAPKPGGGNFANYVFRAGNMQQGTTTSNTLSRMLGQADMTITSGTALDGSLVDYRIAVPNAANDNPLWQEDGVVKTQSSGNASSSPLSINGAAVPEPASLGLLAFAGLGLLRRRRA